MLYFWENNNNMARSIRLLQHRRIVIRVHDTVCPIKYTCLIMIHSV